MSKRSLPPATDAPRPSSLSRRGLLAAAAAVPAGAAVLSAAPAIADPTVTGGETRLVDVTLADVPLVDVDGDASRDLAEQPATMVGVTWPTESAAPQVHVRGLDADQQWTEWFELETAINPESGQEASATEVAWIGVVSALQIRATLEGADVTENLTAHVITTSPAPADEEVAKLAVPEASEAEKEQLSSMSAMSSFSTKAKAVAPNPTTPTLGPGAPTFVPRAAWGADESRVGRTYGRDELKSVFIHHTAGSNNYSSKQSAEQVRGYLRYHNHVLGWADIGYNILVSQYGQIYEGRSGGLHRNIQGAHALGFNRGSFAISVMGDYSDRRPSRAVEVALAEIIGWKLLTTFRASAWDRVWWTPEDDDQTVRYEEGVRVQLPTVMGHRDVNYTECPGDGIYDLLGQIRGEANAFKDGGDKSHVNAFARAGGASKLGTVTQGAHRTGPFTATVLTKGLVLQEGSGRATGYATPFATQWRASWGRPTNSASTRFGQTVQKFQNGNVVKTGSSVQFHNRRFIDVPTNLKFRSEIEQLASRGITEGWSDGSYRPLAPIQRDAMVAFVYRALGEPAFTPPTTSPFTDMPPSRRFYKEITWAHREKIVQGWPDGTFRPTASVERGAVAAFLYRASEATATSTSNKFSDVSSRHQFGKEITWLVSQGITNGWPDGTFRPVAPINRDAMAAFMIRWMTQRGL